jgi:hypothetical protein
VAANFLAAQTKGRQMAYANEVGSKRAEWLAAQGQDGGRGYMPSSDCKRELLAELKAATKNPASALHECRITLRERHHASYLVTIADAPFSIFTTIDHRSGSDRRGHYEVDAFKGRAVLFYSVLALKALAEVNAIAHSWNYDRSDIQTDYFDVGFYFDVEFNHEQGIAEKVAMMAAGGQGLARRTVAIADARAVLNDHLASIGAELLEEHWNTEKRVYAAFQKAFGLAAAESLINRMNAIADAETFDAAAAREAGLAVLRARVCGEFQGDKAKKLNAAKKRTAKKAAQQSSEATIAEVSP